MVDPNTIRQHMAVVGSDGAHVGTVDSVSDGRLKLTRSDSRDGSHHHVPLTQVARVDDRVHLTVPAISAIPGGSAEAAAPSPTLERGIAAAAPRRGFLPLIAGIVALLLLFFLYKGCVAQHEAVAVETPAERSSTIAADAPAADPQGVSGLATYLGGTAPVPATFAFEKVNFDTGKSAVRPADQGEIDQVADVLRQHGSAHIRITGYADARGSDPANRQLGQARADAVKAAFVAKGVEAARIETASGGEADPVDSNATAGGRFENRRTELIVTTR